MRTECLTVDRERPERDKLERAAAWLRAGELVAFPTETVYGLGANGLDDAAARRVYAAKGRPSDNPLILHIADLAELDRLVLEIPAAARKLLERYWPGPLTVIFRRAAIVPDAVTGGLDTVAVRMPDSTVARALIRLAGVPLAGPSANTSGRPSPTSARAVLDDLDGRIAGVVDAGECRIGVESTVVDCTPAVPVILRPGAITREMLTEVLGAVELDPALGGGDFVPKAPGMKYKHYAPRARMTLFEGDAARIPERLTRAVAAGLRDGEKIGALVSAPTARLLPAAARIVVYGGRGDAAALAVCLYEALRRFDRLAVDAIYAEGVAERGLGLAVMNRLRKASAYRIVKV